MGKVRVMFVGLINIDLPLNHKSTQGSNLPPLLCNQVELGGSRADLGLIM